MKNLLLKIKTFGSDELGYLSFFESSKDFPFEIKRIYYTYDVPENSKRGMHAHKEIDQILWCPYGVIEVLLNDGKEEMSFLLDSPDKALIVFRGYWHDLYWLKENSILCVAASEYYNEEDYIRDYSDFLKFVKEGYWNEEN